MAKKRTRQHGATLSEYGISLALIGITALGALGLLGANIGNLLTRPELSPTDSMAARMTRMDFGVTGSSGNPSVPGAPSGNADPGATRTNRGSAGIFAVSGKAPVTAGANGTVIEQVRHTMTLARRMEALALQTEDPDLRRWIESLAFSTYHLGASEGSLDGIHEFMAPGSYREFDVTAFAYYNTDHWRSDLKYQIENGPSHPRLKNDPTIKSSPLYQQVIALAKDAVGVADQFIGNNPIPNSHGFSSTDIMQYDQIKKVAQSILHDPNHPATADRLTYQDANQLDQTANE